MDVDFATVINKFFTSRLVRKIKIPAHSNHVTFSKDPARLLFYFYQSKCIFLSLLSASIQSWAIQHFPATIPDNCSVPLLPVRDIVTWEINSSFKMRGTIAINPLKTRRMNRSFKMRGTITINTFKTRRMSRSFEMRGTVTTNPLTTRKWLLRWK